MPQNWNGIVEKKNGKRPKCLKIKVKIWNEIVWKQKFIRPGINNLKILLKKDRSDFLANKMVEKNKK